MGKRYRHLNYLLAIFESFIYLDIVVGIRVVDNVSRVCLYSGKCVWDM